MASNLVGTNESLHTEVISNDARVNLGSSRSSGEDRGRAQRRRWSVGMARGSSGCSTTEKSIPRLNEREGGEEEGGTRGRERKEREERGRRGKEEKRI